MKTETLRHLNLPVPRVPALVLLLALLAGMSLSAQEYQYESLTALTTRSIELFDELIPQTRMPEQVSRLDASVWIQQARQRTAEYGREEEFAYIFDAVEEDLKNGVLDILLCQDALPYPGFNYVHRESADEEKTSFILFSSADGQTVPPSGEPLGETRLADFFGSLAHHYYDHYSHSMTFTINQRNLINELVANMTGRYLTGLMLLEMSEYDPASGNRDFSVYVTSSLADNNLEEYSMLILGTPNEVVYDNVRYARAGSTTGNMELALHYRKSAADFYSFLQGTDFKTLSEQDTSYLAMHSSYFLIYLPWFLQNLAMTNPLTNPGHPMAPVVADTIDRTEKIAEMMLPHMNLLYATRDSFIRAIEDGGSVPTDSPSL